jgi:hypothetical protein
MPGFGQRYWVQVVYMDGTEQWVPVNGGRSTARDSAALWMQQPEADFALVLDGRVPRGGVPKRQQILDEFNRPDDDRAEGCKVYQAATKAARGRLRSQGG